MAETKHTISLGAGVQSSTMALMATHGEITPMPDAAIFADTGDEPRSVYDWLNWLETKLPFPVVRVSIGKLSLATLSPRISRNAAGYTKPSLPVFFDNGGMGQRHCTLDFKVTPILRYSNMLRGSGRVTQWIGISFDELDRMKPSQKPWCENRWPLVEMRVTRSDCLKWMAEHNYPKPPRSACYYCPYHSDDQWIHLRDNEPEEWKRAIEFEKQYQAATKEAGALKHVPFLHADRVPLESVNLTAGKQTKLFTNECEGLCGV